MGRGLIIGLGALGAGALAFFALRGRAHAFEGGNPLALLCEQFPDDMQCLSPEDRAAIQRSEAYQSIMKAAVRQVLGGEYLDNFNTLGLRSLVERMIKNNPQGMDPIERAQRVGRLSDHRIPTGVFVSPNIENGATWWHAAAQRYGGQGTYFGAVQRWWVDPRNGMDPWKKAQLLLDWLALWDFRWTFDEGGRPALSTMSGSQGRRQLSRLHSATMGGPYADERERQEALSRMSVTEQARAREAWARGEDPLSTGLAFTLPPARSSISPPTYPVEAFVSQWVTRAPVSATVPTELARVRGQAATGETRLYLEQPGVKEMALNLEGLGITQSGTMGCPT